VEISVRSYLAAGTAAVVGAGAIALAPALPGSSSHVAHLPAPMVAEVGLTGFGISIPDILGVLQNFGGGLLPNLGGVSPLTIPAIVAEFVKEAGPGVLSTAGKIFTNTNTAVLGLAFGPNSIPTQFGSAIAGIPTAVITAVSDLKSANFAGALQAINEGLLAPAKAIAEVIYNTASGVFDYASAQVGTLAKTLPDVLAAAIKAVTGVDATALINTIKTALTGLIDKLPSISFPGGWSGGWGEGSHHHSWGGHHEGGGEGSGSEGSDSDSDDVTPVAAASVAAVATPKVTAPPAAASESAAPAGDSTPKVVADSPKVSSNSVDASSDSTDGVARTRRGAATRDGSASSQRGRHGADSAKAAAARAN
jgi:hypothetical protein